LKRIDEVEEYISTIRILMDILFLSIFDFIGKWRVFKMERKAFLKVIGPWSILYPLGGRFGKLWSIAGASGKLPIFFTS